MSVGPSFLPWLRFGLAAQIDSATVNGLAAHDSATATVAVRLVASGESSRTEDVPSPPVRLRGPVDIVGLAANEILRCEPVDGTTDAEPNYFAHIELASPDLPWRFTPAAPGGRGRLQPWLALVVVEDRVGVFLESRGAQARSVLHVDSASVELPDLAQCWSWAHAQADCALDGGVAAALRANPSSFRSRLMCPRRLPPDRSWIACVVPTFEAGRRAGLGEPVEGRDLGLAWSQTDVDVRLPVYHSWRFSTGPSGDFESLVRRLTPRELAGTIGRRDLDVSSPGEPLPSVPGLFLSFKGALVAPGGEDRPWPARHHMATVSIFHDLMREQYDASEDDPVVGASAYGAAQAHGPRGQWFAELNTEPPHRVVAALGAAVVRRDQEAMMAAAWQHAAEHRGVNRLLGRARLGWEVARIGQSKLEYLTDPELLQLAGPALARLRTASGGATLRAALAASSVPQGLVSGAMRRRCRTVPGLTPAAEITAAALADPAGFGATWQSYRPPMGADLQPLASSTSDTRPAEGPIVGTPSRAEPTRVPSAGHPDSGPKPGPAVPEPAVPEPAVPEPAVPEPAVPGPAALGLAVPGPAAGRASVPGSVIRPESVHSQEGVQRPSGVDRSAGVQGPAIGRAVVGRPPAAPDPGPIARCGRGLGSAA